MSIGPNYGSLPLTSPEHSLSDPVAESRTLDNFSENFEPAKLETASHDAPVWVRVGRLFDGNSNHLISPAHLVYDAVTIRYVGMDDASPPANLLRAGQTEPDANLPEITVLPMLIEAHAHLFLDGTPVDFEVRRQYLTLSPEKLLAKARNRWPRILATGVGTVRDAGDKDGVGLHLAAECAEMRGQIATTGTIDSPGAAIHHQGRYASFMARPVEEFTSPAACVADRVARGANRIKLIATGIINFKAGKVTAPPQMSVDEVRAFVEAATAHGLQSFAHASGTDGIENVIEGGVTTVEHGFFVTRQQLAKLRDRQIGWVPTFAPVQVQIDRASELGWDDEITTKLRRIIEGHSEMLRLASEMGVTIIAGSDAGSCGVPHGLGFLRELELMQMAGMPPIEVLQSATGTSAALLGFSEPIGRLAPGCRTRLIFTRHNPTVDVTVLGREKMILFDGQVIAGSPLEPQTVRMIDTNGQD